jgi:hypothetical protein
MAYGGDPKSSAVVATGIVGAILLLAIVLATQALFYNVQRLKDVENEHAPRPRELVDLQSAQRAQLDTYRWVNQKDGVAAIPIDRAIDLFVHEVNSTTTPTTIPTATASQPASTSVPGTPR